MAQLIELRSRAARHGGSAEAEHREILPAALAPKARRRSLKQLLGGMPAAGTDEAFARVPQRARRVRL